MENEETIDQPGDEQTPANDAPQIDTKAFNELKARLDKLEAKGNRPGILSAGNPVMAPSETKAYANFLRTGDKTECKARKQG